MSFAIRSAVFQPRLMRGPAINYWRYMKPDRQRTYVCAHVCVGIYVYFGVRVCSGVCVFGGVYMCVFIYSCLPLYYPRRTNKLRIIYSMKVCSDVFLFVRPLSLLRDKYFTVSFFSVHFFYIHISLLRFITFAIFSGFEFPRRCLTMSRLKVLPAYENTYWNFISSTI